MPLNVVGEDTNKGALQAVDPRQENRVISHYPQSLHSGKNREAMAPPRAAHYTPHIKNIKKCVTCFTVPQDVDSAYSVFVHNGHVTALFHKHLRTGNARRKRRTVRIGVGSEVLPVATVLQHSYSRSKATDLLDKLIGSVISSVRNEAA